MPDARLERTRRSLPEDYQFGDARPDPLPVYGTSSLQSVQYQLAQLDQRLQIEMALATRNTSTDYWAV